MSRAGTMWWELARIGLMLGGLVILARRLPTWLGKGVDSRPGKRRHVSLVESLYLGPERGIHLIEVDGVRLLVGASRAGLTLLAEQTNQGWRGGVGGHASVETMGEE